MVQNHWPLWMTSDIPNAFACDRTSKAADYATLQVVTDSCGDLRFVLRELAYCIEDDRGSFQPTG
jgi:hypothetical protein